jgi:RsiW-degrading membrane proteinase PrsW (M82 family)
MFDKIFETFLYVFLWISLVGFFICVFVALNSLKMSGISTALSNFVFGGFALLIIMSLLQYYFGKY